MCILVSLEFLQNKHAILKSRLILLIAEFGVSLNKQSLLGIDLIYQSVFIYIFLYQNVSERSEKNNWWCG